MNNIDLNKIIETECLDVKDVAIQLFPSNKYPKLALDRVLKGEAYLDTNQVSRLSHLTGLPISVLFSSGWKYEAKKECIIFSFGEYITELNTTSNITKIYHKKSMFHESVLHKSSITLNDYIETINKLIIKHSKDEQSKN